MRKKILITGGTGLLALNWAISVKNHYEIFLVHHQRIFKIDGVKFGKLDLENYQNLLHSIQKISPDMIIHTASLTNIEKCEFSPKVATKINVDISRNIAKVSKYFNIKLIHISTDHLFSNKKIYYKETDKTSPINIYGKSKIKAEKEILKINNKTLIIRTNFFGWGTDYRKSFSDFVIENLEKQKKIYLFDDVFFTPILIEELVKIVHSLIKKDAYGVYNVGGNSRISKFEFGMSIANFFKLDNKFIIRSSINQRQDLIKRPKEMSLLSNKAMKVIGYKFGSINKNILALKKQRKKYENILKPYIPYGKHHIDISDVNAVTDVLNYGWLTQGPKVEEFEKKIAKYVGSKFAISVTSCTAGLHLAVAALDIKKSEYLVTSPITFVSTANAALFNGAKVAFADIHEESINISPISLKKTANKLGDKMKIIIPVHFGGAPCDMESIKKIADKSNSVIIEDAAHALGSFYKNGKRVGCCDNSLMTIFSFHPVKAIATGEGGIITTNNKKLYKKLLRLRSHGINKLDDNFINKNNAYTEENVNPWYYEMQSLGYHYRLNDIQCALGISQLKKLNKFLFKRQKIIAS